MLLQQRWLVVFQLFGRNDYRCGYLVIRFQVEDADALGGAAGGADSLGVATNDFAELAYDNQFREFIDKQNRCRLSYLCGCLEVIDTLSATRGKTVFVHVRPLAEAIFSDRQNQRLGYAQLLINVLECLLRGLKFL